MLPGLVLTVGLVAQSIGALVSPAARNPEAPRFVNIGDDIIQSATAAPIAPAAACAPIAPAAPIAVPDYVVVPAATDDAEEVAPVTEEQRGDEGVETYSVFPIAAGPFLRRPHPRPHHGVHASLHAARMPQMAHAPIQHVMLPSFPTVHLPATFAPSHASLPPQIGR